MTKKIKKEALRDAMEISRRQFVKNFHLESQLEDIVHELSVHKRKLIDVKNNLRKKGASDSEIQALERSCQ